MRFRYFTVVKFFIVLLLASAVHSQQLVITTDHADGVYDLGQAIHWTIESKGESAPSSIDYTLKRGQLTDAGSGSITLTNGSGTLDARIDQPGTILAEFKTKNSDGKDKRNLSGAIAG